MRPPKKFKQMEWVWLRGSHTFTRVQVRFYAVPEVIKNAWQVYVRSWQNEVQHFYTRWESELMSDQELQDYLVNFRGFTNEPQHLVLQDFDLQPMTIPKTDNTISFRKNYKREQYDRTQ